MHISCVVATTARLQTTLHLTAHFKRTFKTVPNVQLTFIAKEQSLKFSPVYCSFKELIRELLKIRIASKVEPAQSQVKAPPLFKQVAPQLQVCSLQSSVLEGGRSIITF